MIQRSLQKETLKQLLLGRTMQILIDAIGTFSSLSMEQINGIIAMLALAVAGLAVYLALVTVKGKKR